MNIFEVGKCVGEHVREKINELGNTQDFTDLAVSAIQHIEPFNLINSFDWEHDIVMADSLPPQKLAGGAVGFGEPAITLYTSPDDAFFVEMYHWHSQDMTIHDHPFSGAFCVIHGECLHEEFTFTSQHDLDAFQIGSLFRKKKSTLKRGEVVAINKNRELIHRNLHTLNPTITFIVRTMRDNYTENFIYTESGLAMKPEPSPKGILAVSSLKGLLYSSDLNRAYKLYEKFMNSNISFYEKFTIMDLMTEFIDIDLVMNQSKNMLPINNDFYADALREALLKNL